MNILLPIYIYLKYFEYKILINLKRFLERSQYRQKKIPIPRSSNPSVTFVGLLRDRHLYDAVDQYNVGVEIKQYWPYAAELQKRVSGRAKSPGYYKGDE